MPRRERSASSSQRTSGYLRALGGLDDTPAPAARDEHFVERLGRWLDWTQAIALAAALAEAPACAAGRPLASRADEHELAHLRRELAQRIAEACADLASDFNALRQQVLACQMAMDARIGPLRRRVRATRASGPDRRGDGASPGPA